MLVRVVNLDERKDRLTTVAEEIEKLGVQWERYRAYNPVGIKGHWHGSSWSHIDVLRNAEGLLLVCEDDVTFLQQARDVFDKAFDQLPADWDMLYLGGNVKRPAERYSENLFRIKEGVHCNHAILYSQKARELILRTYDVMSDKLYDNWLYHTGQSMMKCFICYPVVAYQKPGFSDVRDEYMDYYIEMRSNEIRHLK